MDNIIYNYRVPAMQMAHSAMQPVLRSTTDPFAPVAQQNMYMNRHHSLHPQMIQSAPVSQQDDNKENFLDEEDLSIPNFDELKLISSPDKPAPKVQPLVNQSTSVWQTSENDDIWTFQKMSDTMPQPTIYENLEKPTRQQRLRKKDSSKRTRTAYSSEQVAMLEKTFQETMYTPRMLRVKLSKELHLSETNIKVWFQNRRMKSKQQKRRNEKLTTLADVETPVIFQNAWSPATSGQSDTASPFPWSPATSDQSDTASSSPARISPTSNQPNTASSSPAWISATSNQSDATSSSSSWSSASLDQSQTASSSSATSNQLHTTTPSYTSLMSGTQYTPFRNYSQSGNTRPNDNTRANDNAHPIRNNVLCDITLAQIEFDLGIHRQETNPVENNDNDDGHANTFYDPYLDFYLGFGLSDADNNLLKNSSSSSKVENLPESMEVESINICNKSLIFGN